MGGAGRVSWRVGDSMGDVDARARSQDRRAKVKAMATTEELMKTMREQPDEAQAGKSREKMM